MLANILPVLKKRHRSPRALRVIDAAQLHILERGYSALRMDDLARELGMSKKTIYSLFTSKEELLQTVFVQFARGMIGLQMRTLQEPGIRFSERLKQFMQNVAENISKFRPSILMDIHRHAPDVYRQVEEMRAKIIPQLFGELLEQGQKQGMIRKDINVRLVCEVHLAAVQHLMRPDTLYATHLTPAGVGASLFDLLFNGVMTSRGRLATRRKNP